MKILFIALFLFVGQLATAQCFQWTGVYFGLNAGYAWGRADFKTMVPPTNHDWFTPEEHQKLANLEKARLNPCGFVGGAQVGYNWQACSIPFVIGVETDIDTLHLKKSRKISENFVSDAPASLLNLNREIKTSWIYTLRGRLGYACNCWFPFFTGGFAAAQLRTEQVYFDNFNSVVGFSNPDPFERADRRRTVTGWTAGGGVEYAFSRCASVCLTYLYTRFEKIRTSKGWDVAPFAGSNNIFHNSIHLTAQMVRFGFNWRI